VPVFDLAKLLAEAPPPARRIARLPRHHTYQRAVTGPKAFHRDVERALVPASEKDMMDGGLTEAGLRSTPLAEITALIWPLVASWGSGLVSILQMCILAKSSDFPRGKNTYLPGNTGLRPEAIRWFIKCGRVLMPGVFGKYTLDYPQEFEDYWRSMIPPGTQPRRNLSKIDDNRWTRMRLAGPNGISMIAVGLVIWRLQLARSREDLERWGWMVVEVQRVMEVLVKDIPACIPQLGSSSSESSASGSDVDPASTTDMGSKRKPSKAHTSKTKKQRNALGPSTKPPVASSSRRSSASASSSLSRRSRALSSLSSTSPVSSGAPTRCRQR
jgi:hypothetical protein